MKSPKRRWILVVMYAAALCGASLVPSVSVDVPGPLEELDKLFHFAGYAVFAVVGLNALRGARLSSWKRIAAATISCFVYGLAMECLQGALPINRELSLGDMAANGAGALTAGLFLRLLKHPLVMPRKDV